jgi:hypothetical protein
MARSKKTIQELVQGEYPEFANEVAGLSADQLNNRLATLAKNLEESETAKEDDEALEQAKAEASELAAPYRDAKKALRAKSKYVISLLKEKGADA